MALTSEATAVWNGDLMSGSGKVSLDSSKRGEFDVNWKARTDGVAGTTNPEELLGAAHAACYSMQLSNTLAKAGHPPTSIQTTAAVTFAVGTGVAGSHLLVNATVPGITEEEFLELANDAKLNCPISVALAGIPITLEAELA
jgi:lipoyl-dependent peroxiredoxin